MNEQTSEFQQRDWHHGGGCLCYGTLRIARADFDTDPSPKYQQEIFDWIVKQLNTRPTQSPIVQAADEMEKALKELYSHTGGMPVAEMYGNSAQYEHALGIYERALAALEQYAKAKGQ
jgi:hypothetical protein